MPFSAQHLKAGRLHLMKADPVMKKLIKQVGPFTAKMNSDRFGVLVNSIISQQISTAAAATIKGRLLADVDDGQGKYSIDAILRHDIDSLRELGVSKQKATYVLDLASKVQAGDVALKNIARRKNDAIIDELTQVKGIGVWTAQMFLIFSLGRLDVMPADDLGIQNAVKRFYDLDERPTAAEVRQFGEAWHPYESIASWYLWQGLDLKQ